jgi:hypothetical protein
MSSPRRRQVSSITSRRSTGPQARGALTRSICMTKCTLSFMSATDAARRGSGAQVPQGQARRGHWSRMPTAGRTPVTVAQERAEVCGTHPRSARTTGGSARRLLCGGTEPGLGHPGADQAEAVRHCWAGGLE